MGSRALPFEVIVPIAQEHQSGWTLLRLSVHIYFEISHCFTVILVCSILSLTLCRYKQNCNACVLYNKREFENGAL